MKKKKLLPITMMGPWIIFLGLLINLVIFPQILLADEGEILLPANPLEGRKVFINKSCGKCHAIWGQGGSFGPDLVMMSKGKSFLELAGLLWNHSPKMVEIMEEKGLTRPTFSPEEMSSLIAYLYYLNYFDPPGSFTRGEKVFEEKKCNVCHSLGGKGGKVGPALDKYQRYMSSIFIAQAMWNHGPKMPAKIREMGIEWPNFQGQEVADILAYIRGMGKTDEKGEKIYMSPGNPKNGEKLFSNKGCLTCHTIGLGERIGPDLANEELQGSVSEIANRMWNHGPEMWETMDAQGIPIPELSGEEMADIIAYVYFSSYMDKGGDPYKGKEYFAIKGCASCHSLGVSFTGHDSNKVDFAIKGCTSCHSLGQAGERIGPDLSESEAITSPVHLASSMWNHAPVMEKMLQESGLPWPRFEGNEMRDLVKYIRTLKKETRKQN